MAGEQELIKNIETPKPIEAETGALNEQPDLSVEKAEKPEEKVAEKSGAAPATVVVRPVKSVISEYEQREKQIENFLARDLEEIYLGLPLDKQAEFRREGEETAQKINKLLEKTKINLGKIVNLIRKWLALLPGVNKFFLEQEAKIKADEIVKLRSKN
jgi:hypothetical protein